MEKIEKYEGSFIAHDQAGEAHTIEIFSKFITRGSHTYRGVRTFVTESGDPVNYIRKGKYEIVHTDTLLFSDDPKAP